MREVGRGWDEVRRDLEQSMRWVWSQLRAGPPFPVYGVEAPQIGRGQVSGADGGGKSLLAVAVRWGAGAGVARPSLWVQTARAQPVWQNLADVLADEVDRLYDAGVEVAESEPGEETDAALVIDGASAPVRVRRSGEVWAARALRDVQSGRVVVTVVGQGVPLEAVRLAPVADLAGLVPDPETWVASQLAQAPDEAAPEDLDLPQARGLEGHRDLVDWHVADTERHRSAVAAGRRYRRPRDWETEAQRRWETAVRAQMRLAGQGRDEANEAVTALVNQMVMLVENADWFADTGLRRAAVEESIRFAVFDSDAPAVPRRRPGRGPGRSRLPHRCLPRASRPNPSWPGCWRSSGAETQCLDLWRAWSEQPR